MVYPIARGNAIAGTAIAACLFLQEKISLFGVAGISLISFGVLLLEFINTHQKRGIFFSIIVAALIISYSITDKLGVGILHPLAYIFGLTSLTTIFLAPYILINKKKDYQSHLRR